MVYLIWSLKYGKEADANPWGATGLEWQTESPPPTHNFDVMPIVTERGITTMETLAHQFDDVDQQREASTLGMWIFLVTEVLFFGGLLLAYSVYRSIVFSRIRRSQ